MAQAFLDAARAERQIDLPTCPTCPLLRESLRLRHDKYKAKLAQRKVTIDELIANQRDCHQHRIAAIYENFKLIDVLDYHGIDIDATLEVIAIANKENVPPAKAKDFVEDTDPPPGYGMDPPEYWKPK